MEALILEAPKVYLDTCHLINIARLRKNKFFGSDAHRDAYRQIDYGIRTCQFGLIFNPLAPLEWVDGNATLEGAREIADVVDTACLQYELEADSFVYLYEILQDLRRIDTSLSLPDFDIIHVRRINEKARRANVVLLNTIPNYFDEDELVEYSNQLPVQIPFSTAKETAQWAWEFKQERPRTYHERVDGHKAAFSRSRDSYETVKTRSSRKQDVVSWMKEFLRVDRVLSALNPNADIDVLLNEIKLARCPAIRLFLNAYDKQIRAASLSQDNDVDDWLYLPAFVYADVILTERRLRGYVSQADQSIAKKATHDPTTGIKLLKKWIDCGFRQYVN